MRSQVRGVKARRKPTRALQLLLVIDSGMGRGDTSVHRCRVSKCLSKISLDLVHRRKVKLLKQLRAHLNTLGSSQPVQALQALSLRVEAIKTIVLLVELLAVLGGSGHDGDFVQDGRLLERD